MTLVNKFSSARITSKMKKIILASASPQRKELLEQIGLQFEVEPSNRTEITSSTLKPHELARLLSREKAMAVASKHQHAIVIAADTFIICRGKVMGKPGTEAEAREMLAALSGKTHSVITGFTIIDADENKVVSQSVETKVYMKRLTPAEIDAYVKSGEPRDRAGAYAIQGLGSVLIDKIEGDYFNVVGLPLSALTENLKEFEIDIL